MLQLMSNSYERLTRTCCQRFGLGAKDIGELSKFELSSIHISAKRAKEGQGFSRSRFECREGHPDDSAPVPNVRSLGGQSLDDAQKLRDNESRLAEKETKLAGVEAELRDFLAKKDNWRIYRLAGQQETLETLTEPEKAVAERINKCRECAHNSPLLHGFCSTAGLHLMVAGMVHSDSK